MHVWGVPSGHGLEIGRVWGRLAVDASAALMKRSDFEGIAVSDINSAQAREQLRWLLDLPDSEGDTDER